LITPAFQQLQIMLVLFWSHSFEYMSMTLIAVSSDLVDIHVNMA